MSLSHFRKRKFKHEVAETFYLFCNYGLNSETIYQFFLHSSNNKSSKQALLDRLSQIDAELLD